MIFRLVYLSLFLSFDVLLYIRLGKRIIKANYWLIAVSMFWLGMLIFHLPLYQSKHSMQFKDFINLSVMVVQLLMIHYVGRFAMWRVERSHVIDEIKQHSLRILSFIFNTGIFVLFFIIHVIFIITWSN